MRTVRERARREGDRPGGKDVAAAGAAPRAAATQDAPSAAQRGSEARNDSEARGSTPHRRRAAAARLAGVVNVLELPHERLEDVVLDVFAASGVDHAFEIGNDTLRAFLRSARSLYRANPYHNWHHAVHVTLNSFRFASLATHALQPADVLALLVAALCHDLDHPGVPNRHLVDARHPLALRYNNKSVLENHSAERALELLRQQQLDLLRGAAEQRGEVEAHIRALILATDIADHENVRGVKERFRAHLPLLARGERGIEARRSLLCVTLLCADIGIVSEPQAVYLDGLRRLFLENAASAGAAAAFSPARWHAGQVGFLESYAAEVFGMLHAGVPSLGPFVARLEGNSALIKHAPVERVLEWMGVAPAQLHVRGPAPAQRDESGEGGEKSDSNGEDAEEQRAAKRNGRGSRKEDEEDEDESADEEDDAGEFAAAREGGESRRAADGTGAASAPPRATETTGPTEFPRELASVSLQNSPELLPRRRKRRRRGGRKHKRAPHSSGASQPAASV
jgi:hypothetical protein